MPTEVVIAPQNGVTVSFAGHNVFAGHIFAMTFDAIQVGSKAHNSLVREMHREGFRESLHGVDNLSRNLHNLNSKLNTKLGDLDQLGSQPYVRKYSLRLVLKNLVYRKLDTWATSIESYIDSLVGNDTDASNTVPNPDESTREAMREGVEVLEALRAHRNPNVWNI